MLVVEQSQALALKLNNPARVLSTIPTAKRFHSAGDGAVVIPHGMAEVRTLRTLGIDAPSPILHYYDWPGRFTPYAHQRDTAAFLTLYDRCLVLNEIGCGKTQSALWAADYMMQLGLVKKVLIVSPLSTLERVWGDAIFMDFVHRKAVTLHGSAPRRRRLLNTEADFYIVNHDGFSVIADDLGDRFQLVIVDEAAVLRNAGTSRFKRFYRWTEQHPETRLWLMTGTPTPNEPTDAWALARLIKSPFLTSTFTAFREQVMHRAGPYKWLPRPESLDIVRHVLHPSIRYTRDECLDLPSTVVQSRSVDMTAEQAKYYQTMTRRLVIELQESDNDITAVNEAVKLQKLVQIACGVAYDDMGNNVELDCTPRVKLTRDLIDEAGGKVIVFVPLTGTLHMLERELAKHFTVGVVNGAVTASKRNVVFNNFQNSKDPRVLIAHPATMAHGLTLTAADTIIWYGPINSNEQYVQANGRIERIGKRKVSNVIHIAATELEQKMYERLKNKQKLQGLLLDMLRDYKP